MNAIDKDLPDLNISRISQDPQLRLGAAVAAKALMDWRSADPVEALDALAWWLDPTGGALWLDCLGDYPNDPDKVFMAIVGGLQNGKKAKTKAGRPHRELRQNHGSRRDNPIPGGSNGRPAGVCGASGANGKGKRRGLTGAPRSAESAKN